MTEKLNEDQEQAVVDNEENREEDYLTESAAEVAVPNTVARRTDEDRAFPAEEKETHMPEETVGNAGLGMGVLALVLALVSLFVWPTIMGAAGIIVGFIARRRGARTSGTLAIWIGAASIIVSWFILPFLY